MKESQKDIYYVTGESIAQVEDSPFIEYLTNKGYDVLFLVDPIDEYMVQQMKEFDGKKLVDASKEGLELDEDVSKEEKEKVEKEYDALCKYMKETLGDKVEKVVVSNRMVNTPCILSTGQFGWSANMERIMKAQALRNNDMMSFMMGRKTMELNPNSQLVQILKERYEKDNNDKMVRDLVWLFYETSLISSGFTLDKPSTYTSRIYKMLALGLSGNELDLAEEVDESQVPPLVDENEVDGEEVVGEAVDETTGGEVVGEEVEGEAMEQID